MNQIQLQAMMDGMSAQLQLERSQTQMTLGEMISRLSEIHPDCEIQKLERPHSYRGYYSDLAIEKAEGVMTAIELLDIVKECLGKTFCGYKGGDFTMSKITPVWIANYSECGDKIISINDDGTFVLSEDE